MTQPLLVFDLDGTLVDTAPDLLAALDAVLPRHGLPAMADASLRNAIGFGARYMIKQALGQKNLTLTETALDAINADFLMYYEENICRFSRFYPGTEALLDRFAAAGWSFAVCTNKKERPAKLLLRELGVAECFAAICGGDTFAASKPDPAHLGGTIAAASGSVDHAIMVGDSRTDRDAAHRMDIPFVGVSFGYTPVPMAELGPDILIDRYDDLSLADCSALLSEKAAGQAAAAPPDGS